jgi:hypothetical protein
MPEQSGPAPNPDRSTVYQQLCDSYHKIDDFRAKLLALLPFASAAGLFLLLNDKLPSPAAMRAAGPFFVPIGIFGVVVTLGLFAYEIYGIQKCGELIDTGIRLETEMKVRGQFTSRPNRVINEVFAAAVIYPAVLAGWLFLTLFTLREDALGIAELVFFAGFAGMLAWDVYLVRRAERERKAREADEKARAGSPAT